MAVRAAIPSFLGDRKSTRLNSCHTEIYTLSLHDALPISTLNKVAHARHSAHRKPLIGILMNDGGQGGYSQFPWRSEEHTSELLSHRDLHSFPTRRSSDLDLK